MQGNEHAQRPCIKIASRSIYISKLFKFNIQKHTQPRGDRERREKSQKNTQAGEHNKYSRDILT